MRKPIVAGQFYEEDEEKLRAQLRRCFLSPFGPGSLPEEPSKTGLKALISPHAGYVFSGGCAAHGFKLLAESEKPDFIILLGLSHAGFDNCVSLEDWETPLGVMQNYKAFTKQFSKISRIPINEEAHANEHSIEVQLPFLQFIYEKPPKIVPIIVSSETGRMAESLNRALSETKKKAVIIVSSDFTHFGLNYGYFPFSDNIKENLYNLDGNAIKAIQTGNPSNFSDYVEKTGATICGRVPIETAMRAIKSENIKLLTYYTSGDVMHNYSSAVGYASIAFL
ncbi:MAG: AmmeMemoRadiSam system protein B [Bdellovibrio sp.]|nr:MAG: AmmeMemoRadiSam system protein B [Bdellovibrio sp.]